MVYKYSKETLRDEYEDLAKKIFAIKDVVDGYDVEVSRISVDDRAKGLINERYEDAIKFDLDFSSTGLLDSLDPCLGVGLLYFKRADAFRMVMRTDANVMDFYYFKNMIESIELILNQVKEVIRNNFKG